MFAVELLRLVLFLLLAFGESLLKLFRFAVVAASLQAVLNKLGAIVVLIHSGRRFFLFVLVFRFFRFDFIVLGCVISEILERAEEVLRVFRLHALVDHFRNNLLNCGVLFLVGCSGLRGRFFVHGFIYHFALLVLRV